VARYGTKLVEQRAVRAIIRAFWITGALAVGCGGTDLGDFTYGGGGGGFGATTGGLKDLKYARELVANGRIPPPDALLVEGMFAEHDLAIDGPPCTMPLCLRAAAGIAPELDDTPRGWAQVGLSSAIDPDAWTRPSTTFIFTVDVSGSMGWGYDETTPGEMSRALLHRLTDELRPDDRVAVVTYGSSVSTVLGLTSGADKTTVHQVIGGLSEDGSTSMEAGMKRAYELGTEALGSTDQVRVIVLTDTQPNVGATEASAFTTLVTNAAAEDVYTTTLGFGVGIGPEVLRGMASMRGANAFSVLRSEQVDTFVAEEYPWFTTPIAFDLRVNIALADGWSIDRGLGFPAPSDGEQIGLKANSVFLSRKKGALVAALTPPSGSTASLAGSFSLAYRDAAGAEITQQLPFSYDGTPLTDGRWFAQHGADRAVALALLIEGMHEAAAGYSINPDAAEATLAAAVDRFTADAARLADEDLGVELQFSSDMLALVHDRATQGTLYGY
jgi:Ca-activated chloride channel family protein